MSDVNDPRYAQMAYRPPRHDTMPAAWDAGEAVRQAHHRIRAHNDEQRHARHTARDIKAGKRLLWAVLGVALLILGNGAYGTWVSQVRQVPTRVVRTCEALVSRC